MSKQSMNGINEYIMIKIMVSLNNSILLYPIWNGYFKYRYAHIDNYITNNIEIYNP